MEDGDRRRKRGERDRGGKRRREKERKRQKEEMEEGMIEWVGLGKWGKELEKEKKNKE